MMYVTKHEALAAARAAKKGLPGRWTVKTYASRNHEWLWKITYGNLVLWPADMGYSCSFAERDCIYNAPTPSEAVRRCLAYARWCHEQRGRVLAAMEKAMGKQQGKAGAR